MGLTVEQIHAAADGLDAEGIRPTLAAVRRRLGSGSFTTISEAMTSWRSAKVVTAVVEPLPGEVDQRVTAMGQELWALAMAAAGARLAGEREELAAARAESEQVRAEAVAVADAVTLELEQSRAAAAQEFAALQDQLAAVTARAESDQQLLRAVDLDLQATKVGLARATGELEVLRVERDRLLADERALESDLQATRVDLARTAGELESLRVERDRLLTEARAQAGALVELQRTCDQAVGRADSLAVELDSHRQRAAAEVADALAAASQAQDRARAADKAAQEAAVSLARVTGQVQALTEDRQRLTDALAAAQQRIGELGAPAPTKPTQRRRPNTNPA